MNMFLKVLAVLALASGLAFARVNVNTATQAELESLPQIGPAKAKAIIEHRKKNGPFKSLEDLQKVEGVGPGTADAVKNDVSFTGASTPVAPAAADKPTKDKSAKADKPEKADKGAKDKDNAGKSDTGANKSAANKEMADEKSGGHAKADDKMDEKAAASDDAEKGKRKAKGKDKDKDKEGKAKSEDMIAGGKNKGKGKPDQ